MKLNASFKVALIAALLLATENAAWSDVLPGPAQPDQVSRALRSERPKPQTQVLPPIAAPEEKAKQPLGEQAKKIKFKLNGILLSGNHVYSAAQLELIYKDKIGKTISVADLFEIVQNITNFYRNNGYIISRAILPPQHVKNGVVAVQIIEGYIGEVTVIGNPHGAKKIVAAYGNQIKQNPPLNIRRMEKYLLISNEIPATSVKAVLSPSKTKTGAADLALNTVNSPVTGYTSYDNYGTRYIGPQQMTANLTLNSIVASGDTTSFTVTKTPKGGELTYRDLSYGMPVFDKGNRWLLGGTIAHTHPLFVLQPVQIDGTNYNYYTALSFPWIRTRSESFTFALAFNYLDSYVTILSEKLYTDHLRSADFGFVYNFADRYYGANLIGFNFRQGLPIFGYTSNFNPTTAQTSRPGGRGTYTKFAMQLSRLQALSGPFSVFGLLRGQYAFVPLLASEQFSYGGSQLGRGYDVAEIIGDKGIGMSIEPRYDINIGYVLQSLQLYAFSDFGTIWNYENIGGSPTKQTALSYGGGTRFYFNRWVSGNFMWTQPITKQVAAMQLIGDGKAPRVFFSLVASFA